MSPWPPGARLRGWWLRRSTYISGAQPLQVLGSLGGGVATGHPRPRRMLQVVQIGRRRFGRQHPDEAVVAGGNDHGALVEGPEHGRVHRRRERLVERAEGGQLASSGEAPDADHAVVACRQYLRPVGAENCGVDLAAAGVELRRHLMGAGIEDGHVAGVVGQDHLSSIGAELPVPDNGVFGRVLERTEVLVGVALAAPAQAPLPRRAVVVSDEHAVAGGVEGHAVDEIVVARCSGELDSPAAGEVDDLDDVVVREADSQPRSRPG